MKTKAIAFAIATVLTACGGGGSSDNDSPSAGNNGGGVAQPASLQPTQYEVYKYGQSDVQSGAGAMSADTMTLDGGNQTKLTATSGSDFIVTANNFQVLNRRDGAVLMLCDYSAMGDKTRYVAISTASPSVATAAVKVTNVGELLGKSFYRIRSCSFVDLNDNPQGQSTAPTPTTKKYTINADGSLSVNNGNTASAANFASLIAGNPVSFDAEGTDYLTFYKFNVGGNLRYFAVSRFIPSAGNTSAPELALWVME